MCEVPYTAVEGPCSLCIIYQRKQGQQDTVTRIHCYVHGTYEKWCSECPGCGRKPQRTLYWAILLRSDFTQSRNFCFEATLDRGSRQLWAEGMTNSIHLLPSLLPSLLPQLTCLLDGAYIERTHFVFKTDCVLKQEVPLLSARPAVGSHLGEAVAEWWALSLLDS